MRQGVLSRPFGGGDRRHLARRVSFYAAAVRHPCPPGGKFCEIYRRWVKRRGLSIRQVHRAGEKCFVDYAGRKPTIIDPATGEVREVELFVAAAGARLDREPVVSEYSAQPPVHWPG